MPESDFHQNKYSLSRVARGLKKRDFRYVWRLTEPRQMATDDSEGDWHVEQTLGFHLSPSTARTRPDSGH